jgi:hypothetical protein
MNLEQAVNYLKTNGPKIGNAAQGGDVYARNIIDLYKLYARCPGDPGAQGLLIAAVKEHQKNG